jgi:monovalent cation:proton antiporter-2 (CPA2) family protein
MGFLYQVLIFLAAAAVVVPVSKRFGFGSVLGYLAAGLIIGPSIAGLVDGVDEILHFAETGVVFLLFVIGLELQPSRLRVMRRPVFGLGTAQVIATGAVLSALGGLLGLSWPTAIMVGLSLSLSSTAFALQLLAERKELNTAHGRAAFGVLLFQDLAVIPLIALVPLLAGIGGGAADTSFDVAGFALSVAYLVAFIVGGRYLLRPVLRLIAAVDSHEIFTATSLLLVIGSALLVEEIGYSMGLGAFIAGVLMADSEYRHQLETDIEPFKGLLLGLFFMAVGMSTDLGLLRSEPGLIIALASGLIAVKAVLMFALARAFALKTASSLAIAAILSQGGEFAFVLFTIASGQGLMTPELVARLTLVVTLSMAATPLLYMLQRIAGSKMSQPAARPFDAMPSEEPPIIIAGFGRFGQIVARILNMRHIAFTAMDADVAQVDFVRRYGNKIYYGDASRLDLLRSAKADKARAVVIAVDKVETSLKIAETVRLHFPNAVVFARARDRQHALKLMKLGITNVVRETLHSSLLMATEVLEATGLSPAESREATEIFRKHDDELLRRQSAIMDDEAAIVQSAMAAAAELGQLFESDSGDDGQAVAAG